MKRSLMVLAALILAVTCGCQAMLQREYSEVSQHKERRVEDFSTGYQVASDSASLKEAILKLVSGHVTSGLIRIYSYKSGLESDLSVICEDIINNEPIGNYAVEDITADLSRLLAYSEIRVDVKYRLDKANLDAVEQVSGRAAYEERLLRALREFDTEFAVEIHTYDNTYSTEQLLSKNYYTKPFIGLGMPTIEEKLFPNSGERRIIEVKLKFPHSTEEMISRRDQVSEEADALTAQAAGLKSPESALLLYDLLCERVEFDADAQEKLNSENQDYQKGDESNVYGALVNGKAISEGYALAYKLLCDNSRISCLIVAGKIGESPYYWNMIYLDGDWYHVDAAAGKIGENVNHDLFLVGDSKMPESYKWGTGYPTADSTKYSYEIIAGIIAPPEE